MDRLDQRILIMSIILVLINRSPLGFFLSSRGIRQGDCLYLYIFVIVMEDFSIHMDLSLAAEKAKAMKEGLMGLCRTSYLQMIY